MKESLAVLALLAAVPSAFECGCGSTAQVLGQGAGQGPGSGPAPGAGESSAQDPTQDTEQGTSQGTAPTSDPGTATSPGQPTGNPSNEPAIAYRVERVDVAGSGCSEAGVAVAVSGGTLSVSLSRLSIDLPRGSGATADRRACSIRVPAEVPRGYYVAKLVHRLPYSVNKGTNSSVSLSQRISLHKQDRAQLSKTLARGSAVDDPGGTVYREDAYSRTSSSHDAWCSPQRPAEGILAIDLALSVQRDDTSQPAFVSVRPLALREGIDVVLAPCS